MARVTFDLDVLRSFVAGIELGSFSKAADAQGRSASAISTQMHKLEEQVGALLLKKAGRGLVLTDAGETMLAYARRMLELNDEAVSAVQGHRREGWVRLAVGPDFGDGLLTDILSRFAERFPGEKIDTRIMRTSELVEALHSGKVDVGLAWDTGVITKNHKVIGSVPLRWIASADHPVPWSPGSDAALPLISMEAPCLMRRWATAALDRAGIVWRHNFVSSSLTGLWAATAAGMGISARTTLGLTGRVRVLGEDCTLPELPSLDVIVCRRGQGLSTVAEALANIV
ncbi:MULTISPECIES: LysR substrate-binding domain-containing protein [unclassified Brevundimonas]|uniref:LysR substrate-binding domain-containing protein n=1 Tax=unclassified Brevundimonas TaxID=2622653 RepID=UPI0025BDA10C|nr:MULTISPECIES: LysR substrate-binding domain-containing protein [unclassified Brevundimonas]